MEYQEGNVIIDGVKIHYYRSGGKKPPIVLLHGATDDGLCWGRTAQELAEQFDVIMPDAQGHGLSDRLGPDFSFNNHTKQAAGLVKELGLKRPIIMGHSMGAGTAVNLAVKYPTKFRYVKDSKYLSHISFAEGPRFVGYRRKACP